MTLKGHFDGKHIVLDEPIPADLAPNTPVTVTVSQANGALEQLANMARPCGLPPDFAEQHGHYAKGSI